MLRVLVDPSDDEIVRIVTVDVPSPDRSRDRRASPAAGGDGMSAYSEARDLLAAMHADHERETTTADGTRPLFCGHLDYAVDELSRLREGTP